MIYPVRSLRHIKERQEARIRLLTINKKRYRRQPQIKAAKHVQFSGKTTVCKYQPNDIPAVAIIERPNHIKDISKQALNEVAQRMQIETKSNNENAIRKLVCKKWLSSMREELSSSSISTDSISDKEMEDCYNFFIGLKKAASLLMAGVEIIPRSMSLPELHQFLQDHHLMCNNSNSKLACIACAENYLMDHIPPIENELGDIARRRMSVENIIAMKYPFFTLSIIQQELLSNGIQPPKKIADCREMLMSLEEEKIHSRFIECLQMSICIMLKTMKKKYTQNLNDDFLVLFRECYKKEEIIPEVFE